MQPEPQELQILKQVLGPELGPMVFGLNMLAGSCAQLGQQVQAQAEQIQQLQASQQPVPGGEPATPSSPNPWTGPAPVPQEGP